MAAARGEVLIAAGELDRRITLQSSTEVRDAAGEPVKTWSSLASVPTVWAKVEPLRGVERFQAQQTSADVDTKFTLRWRNDLDETMRILFDGDYYDVHAVIELGRRQGLEVLASLQEPQ